MRGRGFWITLSGALIILAGVLLLVNSLGYARIDVGLVIGSLIGIGVITGGLFIIWSYWRRRPEVTGLERRPERVMRRERFLGDMRIGRQEWELEDMELESWIGDLRLDLTQAHIGEGERAIGLFSLIGDVDIFVPRSLPVAVEVSNVIGKISLPGKKADGFFRWLSFTSTDYSLAQGRARIRVRSIIGDVNVISVG